MSLTLRDVREEDIPACAAICSRAFTNIAEKHNFPSDFPTPDPAMGLLSFMFANPGFYGVVAENDGTVVGSNFLDERGEIVGLGPITVSPDGQNKGVGRLLMEHCMDRSRDRGSKGVRLLQAAYHNRSLALYTDLGFDVQDVLSTLQGPAINVTIDGYTVRPAAEEDIPAFTDLCLRTHGHERQREFEEAIGAGMATVVEDSNGPRGFASQLGYTGFVIAENNDAIKALIGAAPEFFGPGIIVPCGNGEVMRWCMEHGLRIVHQLTLMSSGFFQRPATPYMPSILY